ncbi:MAG: nitrate reductase cytochrome c-type subunit [Phycisphaeraceae bacterium]|nr:nitrate reductase cytochrome c-type subunit [Phycisphaeraceae bacterium]
MSESQRIRSLQVLCAVVIAGALTGLIIGLTGNRLPPHEVGVLAAPRVEEPKGVIPSTRYTEFSRRTHGPNAGFSSRLSSLVQPPLPDPRDLLDQTHEQKLDSLARRSKRRAYNGAPPVIPHAIDQRTPAACLSCHGSGLVIDRIRAPVMSHEPYASCTQCHVENRPAAIASYSGEGNRFAGIPAPTSGERAWTGAPPSIPHATHMRENCLSCHGLTGWPGMRTTHPWRLSCTQCHAPQAELEQAPRFVHAPDVSRFRIAADGL